MRHTRDAAVRDAVRERDAPRINEAVLTIVADAAGKMANLRKSDGSAESEGELDGVVEVVDWGIRTYASYVGMLLSVQSVMSKAPDKINQVGSTSA